MNKGTEMTNQPAWEIGDRVTVGSVLTPRRRIHGGPPRQPAEGTISGFETSPVLGVRVRFDPPINGSDNCLASYNELNHVERST